jgi:hypothetical protein
VPETSQQQTARSAARVDGRAHRSTADLLTAFTSENGDMSEVNAQDYHSVESA